MHKYFFVFLLLTASYSQSFGQSYISAGGIRVGTGIGFTFQQKIAKRTTVEGILENSFRKNQFQLTVLGEQHFPLLSRRFNLYLGGGFHKAWNYDGESTAVNPYGISAIIGAEMTIHNLILSYDFKPAIHQQGKQVFDFHTGISLRYVFYRKTIVEQMKDNHKKRKKKRVKKRKKRQKERNKNGKKINWRFWE